MWTRGALKTRAREILSKSYAKALLVSFIMIILGSDARSGFFEIRKSWDGKSIKTFMEQPINLEQTAFIASGFLGLIILSTIIGIAIRIFLGYPIEVGGQKYFLKSTEEEFNLNEMKYAFEKNNYLPIVKTMFYKEVLIFLWTLLLIIPGIVKSYAYRMTPYILAENSNIGTKRAIELSNQMTTGQKMNMFVLDLSFIGWYILGALAFGVGIILVKPYENAARAELYLILKENAFELGYCNTAELHRVGSESKDIIE